MSRSRKEPPLPFDIKKFVTGTSLSERKSGEYRIYRFVANTQFSITEGDMERLTSMSKQALVRLQVNEPGTIDLYFASL